MGQITIYPDEELEKIIIEKSKEAQRSINNFLIFKLTEIFKKEKEGRSNPEWFF